MAMVKKRMVKKTRNESKQRNTECVMLYSFNMLFYTHIITECMCLVRFIYCYCYYILGEMIEDGKCEMLVCLRLSIQPSIYLVYIWYVNLTEYIHLGSIKDDQPAKRKWVNTSHIVCIADTNIRTHFVLLKV